LHTNRFTVSSIHRNVGILGTWYFSVPYSIANKIIPTPYRTPYLLPPIPSLLPTPHGIFNLIRHWDVPRDPAFFRNGHVGLHNAMIGYLTTGFASRSHFPLQKNGPMHPIRQALFAETANAFERGNHRAALLQTAFDTVCL
jgi:hypothetical protein